MAAQHGINQLINKVQTLIKPKNPSNENPLRTVLEYAGVAPREKSLPPFSYFSDTPKSPWNEFPLGENIDKQIVSWNINTVPHLLIAGRSGSGKSIAIRNLIFHCLLHPEQFSLVSVNLKAEEFPFFGKYNDVILKHVETLEDAFGVVQYANLLFRERYAAMEKAGVNNYTELPTKEKTTIVILDEVYYLFGEYPNDTDTERQVKKQIQQKILEIARLGRAAGVHLVLSTQTPSLDIIPRELKDNLPARLLLGENTEEYSQLALDTEGIDYLPNIMGRGYFQEYGQGQEIQIHFSSQDYVDTLN